MSSYPSLVSDVCELLRSLLFPFDLCAPYVPRLTEPFMSCLEFPGAIFVGIHDDGCEDGLASIVKKNIPEDTAIVDLDSGDIDCNGDRYRFLEEVWSIIPSEARSLLVFEIEALCHDATIVPGNEPMGMEIEAGFDATPLSVFHDDEKEGLDDRAVRDCFLRFYCSILGGYERFLVVPDIDFLVSGNEWFDSEGFLASTAHTSRIAFLQLFVTTQLFQSFIQKRTEASDEKCMLFDECLGEYHSSKMESTGNRGGYGRLGGDATFVINDDQENISQYKLLVDQCAAECFEPVDQGVSTIDQSILNANTEDNDEIMVNMTGDIVMAPSRKKLLSSFNRYAYCVDGNPCFPQKLNSDLFYPREPIFLSADLDEIPVPVLTRSDREMDESKFRRKQAVSHRGVQRQRRCLFQLPKLMVTLNFNCILLKFLSCSFAFYPD